MPIDNFKKDLHEIIDRGFEGSLEVFRKVKDCSYSYNKSDFSNLHTEAMQQFTGLNPSNFLVRLGYFIDSIEEPDTAKVFYSKKQTLENPIFIRFILLNRDKYLDNIRDFCNEVRNKSIDTKVYQVRSDNCHRADWLFQRFSLYIKEKKEDNLFECYENYTIPNLNTREFRSDMKRKWKRNFYPQKLHIIPFVINAEKDDRELDRFIVDFYDFWKSEMLHINCVILLAVNTYESKPSLWRKFVKRHVPTIEPNESNLCLINKKYHIKKLFQSHLKCSHLVKRIKKEEASLEDLWEELCPLIHEALMQK